MPRRKTKTKTKTAAPTMTKREFVAAHAGKPAAEVVSLAADAGLTLTKQAVHQHRSVLKHASNGKRPAALRVHDNGSSSTAARLKHPSRWKLGEQQHLCELHRRPEKLAQLGRLIFELGIDEARHVFDGFESLHSSMEEANETD